VALGRYATDRVFRSLVARVAGARTATGADGRAGSASTWVYMFSWASPTLGWACHCLDVPFWFDCLGAPGVDRVAGGQPPQALARVLHSAAVRFIDGGDPGWPAWSSAPGATAVLGGPEAPDGLQVRPDGYASLSALL
jgi:para-nitrobenzyl esterase